MKAKILSLNLDKSVSFARFQARIASSIKAYSNNDVEVQQFEDIREMFVALQSALENEGLIITAVDTRYYLKFKNALIQAFGTEVAYNPTVLNKIEGLDIDDKKKRLLSAFPEPATVFISDDGLYSGFGMENGSQFLMLLPIDNNRIDGILINGVVPFLKNSIPSQDDCSNYNEEKYVNNEKVANAVQRLMDSNSMVAVNGTRNAEILKSCGDYVKGFRDVFVFTPHVEDKGNVNATEYTAQLAKVSLDLSAANIGACISDIYTANNAKYICISVASGESAVVRKLYMSNNETEDAFVESAAIELIELIGEKAVGKRSIGIEIADDGPTENLITEDDKKAVGKKPIAILAIILGVVIIICAVLGVIFNLQGDNGSLSSVFDSIFGREEVTTEAPTTTEPPTTEAPKPEIDTSLMKISDYIISSILSMTNEEIAQSCVITDTKAPEYITVNGERIESREALARLVTAELGSGFRQETIKAQTVAIYTCLKAVNKEFVLDGVQISNVYNNVVKSAVDEVFGEYLTYNGAIAITPYHNASPTKTLDMSSSLPYLKSVSVEGNPDVVLNDYKKEKVFTKVAFQNLLMKYNNTMALSANPAEWVVVKAHDSAVSNEAGNVTSITVNNIQMSGLEFRKNVLGEKELISTCFTIEYNAEKERFVITTYGKGYCVGMSQVGANYLAVKGDDYKTILSTYYEGTVIAKEEMV